MRITDYKRISDLKPSDLILLDSDTEGTRAITALELSKQLNKVLTNSSSTATPLPVRRMTYRGKNLGNVYTTKQKEAVASGSFDDLFIGDYWVAPNGHTWIIVDFDSFLNTYINNTDRLNRHHITCLAKDTFPNAITHSANTTDWYSTTIFTATLQSKIQEVADFFGATNIVPHQRNTAKKAELTQIDVPTLPMILGSSYGSALNEHYGVYMRQLAYYTLVGDDNFGGLLLQTPNTANNGFLYIDNSEKIQNPNNAQNRITPYRPFVVIAGE